MDRWRHPASRSSSSSTTCCSNSTSDAGWKPVNSGANGPLGLWAPPGITQRAQRASLPGNWVTIKGLSSCGQVAHLNQIVCAFCSMFDGVGWNSSATLPQCLHRSHCAVTAEQQKVLPSKTNNFHALDFCASLWTSHSCKATRMADLYAPRRNFGGDLITFALVWNMTVKSTLSKLRKAAFVALVTSTSSKTFSTTTVSETLVMSSSPLWSGVDWKTLSVSLPPMVGLTLSTCVWIPNVDGTPSRNRPRVLCPGIHPTAGLG